jgi:hypothetical protein
MSPVKYELGFYIPENEILHSHRRENLKWFPALILRYSLLTVRFLTRPVLGDGPTATSNTF